MTPRWLRLRPLGAAAAAVTLVRRMLARSPSRAVRSGAADARRARSALRRPAVDASCASTTARGRCRRGSRLSMYDEPWYIDAPAAELEPLAPRPNRDVDPGQRSDRHRRSRIPRSSTIRGSTSSRAATCGCNEAEVPILREFLLRGGTLTFDDFHGPIEWANVERELKRVFPERKIIDLPKDHPVFSCFYKMDGFPQTPGLGSFLQGRTWEKGGYVAHLRAIEDDAGRADGPDQLEHRHGRRLGVVERRRVSGLREVHRAGVPDGNQRNHLLADTLMTTTSPGRTDRGRRARALGRERILAEIRKVIVGQDAVIDQVLMALFTGGHCLITGVVCAGVPRASPVAGSRDRFPTGCVSPSSPRRRRGALRSSATARRA